MLNPTLANRYHLTTLLGKGAMGTVYRATDAQTGQEVAVKVIARDLAFDEEMLESSVSSGRADADWLHLNRNKPRHARRQGLQVSDGEGRLQLLRCQRQPELDP